MVSVTFRQEVLDALVLKLEYLGFGSCASSNVPKM